MQANKNRTSRLVKSILSVYIATGILFSLLGIILSYFLYTIPFLWFVSFIIGCGISVYLFESKPETIDKVLNAQNINTSILNVYLVFYSIPCYMEAFSSIFGEVNFLDFGLIFAICIQFTAVFGITRESYEFGNFIAYSPISEAYQACFNGNLEILQILKGDGLDLNEIRFSNNKTCLLVACMKGHSEIVEYLLNIGCSFEKRFFWKFMFTISFIWRIFRYCQISNRKRMFY